MNQMGVNKNSSLEKFLDCIKKMDATSKKKPVNKYINIWEF